MDEAFYEKVNGRRTHKVCSRCGKLKPVRDFYRRTGASDGLQSYCKECIADKAREYYKRHPKVSKYKACQRCGAVKTTRSFERDESSDDGYSELCTVCRKQVARGVEKAKEPPRPRRRRVPSEEHESNEWYSGPAILAAKVERMAQPRVVEIYMCNGKPPVRMRI